MEEEFVEFLKENGLQHALEKFEEHKVHSIRALQNLTDEQLERIGFPLGEIGEIKSALKETKEDNRAQEVRRLVDSIRHKQKKLKTANNKTSDQSTSTKSNSKEINKESQQNRSTYPSSSKSRKIRIGWLHKSSVSGKFKQVRFKEGGGVRDITLDGGENTTISALTEKGARLFFPGGVSRQGPLSAMDCNLGNFSQQKIDSFLDTNGSECDFFTYLKSHGLFASRCYLYLITSAKDDETAAGEMEPEQPFAQSTPKSSPISTLYTVCDSTGKCLCSEDEHEKHEITITYEKIMESLYSEVIARHQCVNRAQCFETSFAMDPDLIEKVEEYDPLDEGFVVTGIDKGDKCFLQQLFLTLDAESGLSDSASYHYPSASPDKELGKSKLILHHPEEVWGFDNDQLVIGVVSSEHMSGNVSYSWHKDGVDIKTGQKCCCFSVREPGKYSVTVQHGNVSETSQCISIGVKQFSQTTSPATVPKCGKPCLETPIEKSSEQINTHNPTLPLIKKSEFSLNVKDEIGRGTFGTVFKGQWAGTTVAIKRIQVRRASMIKSALRSEVLIHSMLRHPNIVQIMAVSMAKNELYIISEFVDGPNLEELLFFESEDKDDIKITPEVKESIGKQCVQAVAYLHALTPPVIHRDIKPANVLVSRKSYIAKLCDMGVSKLKAIQTMDQSRTSGIPGTPFYMAPEYLLHNESATVHSDIWSLACTLLELYTEKECWETEEEKTPSSSSAMPFDVLKQKLNNKEQPSYLESQGTNNITIKETLRKCFNYTPAQRPSALDMIAAYNIN